ncbi:hypothetical protein cypCar_00000673 [Cyprinus carpio]|nr:hypothetical protein cypCar_00000673 [Cyprinus carpio]
MGNTATKFRKALISGDEVLACQLYESNPQFKEALEPNASYGEPYQHNTPLHYASRHAMTRLIRQDLKQICMEWEAYVEPEVFLCDARSFLFSKDGNPNKCNVHNETALHLLCMGPQILLSEGALQPRISRPQEDEQKRAECLQMILQWTGAKLDQGEYERANVNATDNKKSTCLHYAAAAGMKNCVELLVKNNADLFVENEDRETPCDCAEKRHHKELALSLESQMVFSQDAGAQEIEAEYAALDRREPYEGLNLQDLRRLKDMLIVETADMLQAPLFTAEALLRAHDWDREKLLEDWMSNAEDCCQRSGVQMPTPPPSGYNAWDTLPSPRTPRTTRSSVSSPDEISLSPTDGLALCGICMCSISVFEDPVDMSCGHEFCRACWEGFLNLKIQEGEAHNIFCPAYDCFQLVPVEVIESVVSREMDKRYLQFDIKCKYDFCWICLEEWKKHSSSTGGYYRCTRYEVIQQVEEQSKEMTVEAENKHKSFQELDCFMHYYTRYKNHEHSYQLEERLLKTAKEKMEQLSKAFIGREEAPPDTTFIEDGVHELLKTRRILKCSYPYSFFLEPKSTKKEIFELMQTDLEMVTEDLAQKVNRPYLRTPRHKIISATYLVQQKRREFLASVARGVAPNDSPEAPRRSFAGGTWDWEYLGFASPEQSLNLILCPKMVRNHPVRGSNAQRESSYNAGGQPQEYSDFQYRRRHRQRRRGDLLRLHSLRSNTPEPHDSSDSTLETHEGGNTHRHGISTALGSLDEDDPNILLAIQLSLQESGLALDPEPQDVLSNDASVGASGSSLPSRLDSAPHTTDPPRASMSSSELLELGDSLMRLGNITSHYTPFNMSSYPDALGNAFTPSDPDCLDPSTNANLLGNIMAWFHDMNPQSIALIPSATSDASPELPLFDEGQSAKAQDEENEVGSPEQGSLSLMKESADVLPSQLLELECVDDAQPPKAEPDLEVSGGSVDVTSAVCPKSSTDQDPQVTDHSSEWEEEVHLV